MCVCFICICVYVCPRVRACVCKRERERWKEGKGKRERDGKREKGRERKKERNLFLTKLVMIVAAFYCYSCLFSKILMRGRFSRALNQANDPPITILARMCRNREKNDSVSMCHITSLDILKKVSSLVLLDSWYLILQNIINVQDPQLICSHTKICINIYTYIEKKKICL